MLRKIALSIACMSSLFAADCSELDTDAKIKVFIKESRETNPLLKKNVSTSLHIKTNDNGVKKEQGIHSLRQEGKKRAFFLSGENAPKCSITKNERDFMCNECTFTSNELCRSYKQDEDSTVIRGTNIDTKDFDLMESKDFTNVCYPVPKNPKYIKIVGKKISGESEYEKIISFYDKNKKIPVTMNMFSEAVLKKVYRSFPKYFKQIDGDWTATVTRARTVMGSEKKYTFETLSFVKKDTNKKHLLYTKPEMDPLLKGVDLNLMYNTNK